MKKNQKTFGEEKKRYCACISNFSQKMYSTLCSTAAPTQKSFSSTERCCQGHHSLALVHLHKKSHISSNVSLIANG